MKFCCVKSRCPPPPTPPAKKRFARPTSSFLNGEMCHWSNRTILLWSMRNARTFKVISWRMTQSTGVLMDWQRESYTLCTQPKPSTRLDLACEVTHTRLSHLSRHRASSLRASPYTGLITLLGLKWTQPHEWFLLFPKKTIFADYTLWKKKMEQTSIFLIT